MVCVRERCMFIVFYDILLFYMSLLGTAVYTRTSIIYNNFTFEKVKQQSHKKIEKKKSLQREGDLRATLAYYGTIQNEAFLGK